MIIVAGIARSGLTATMQMLNAGGYPCIGEYPAFEPYGLGDIPWDHLHPPPETLAVKVVDTQLQFPPKCSEYKVILLNRDLKQQAKSLNNFIKKLAGLPPKKIKFWLKSLKSDYKIIWKWAEDKDVLRLEFEEIIRSPMATAHLLRNFTGFDLDVEKAAGVIIEREPDCQSKLYEADMI